MYYNYKCGNIVIRVWVWNDDFHNEVTVHDRSTHRSYDRSIRTDDNGKFFTWNKKKIYLKNWVRITMKQLQECINRGENVYDDDLCRAIMTDGVDNVRFIVPLHTTTCFGFFVNGDETKDTLCKIDERPLREVKSNYKISLVPVEPDDSVESYHDYYTTDFISFIKSGHIKIVI